MLTDFYNTENYVTYHHQRNYQKGSKVSEVVSC